MPVLMIRYELADEGIAEVVKAVETTFAELRAKEPDGIRYAYLRRVGTTEFIALLELAEGVENPLPGIAAARRLQAAVAKGAVGTAPTPEQLEILGNHRMFG